MQIVRIVSGHREIFFCGSATIENMLCHTDREVVYFKGVCWLDGDFLGVQIPPFPAIRVNQQVDREQGGRFRFALL